MRNILRGMVLVLLLAMAAGVFSGSVRADDPATIAAPAPMLPGFASAFDQQMIGFKGSTDPRNRKLAADLMQSILQGVPRDSRIASPEWRSRADAYWELMKDPDAEIAREVLKETLNVEGTSPDRVELLLEAALNQNSPMRHEAMDALRGEIQVWKGEQGSATKDVPELESALRTLSFDKDEKVKVGARSLWVLLYPGSPYPMIGWRSQYALLAIVPAGFLLLTALLATHALMRRKKLELDFASPGPTVEQAASMGKGMGYLVGILGVAALMMDAWVIRGRAVGMSAGDLVQIISLLNVLASGVLFIVWAGNIQSGDRGEMRMMIRCCLLETILGAVMAAWMAMAFYHEEFLGGHPGPDILLAAGGAIIVSGSGMLVAALIWAAARTSMEARRR